MFADAREARFTGRKRDDSYPAHAAGWCLNGAEITTADRSIVGVSDTLGRRFDR
jgi:hypothetical protein